MPIDRAQIWKDVPKAVDAGCKSGREGYLTLAVGLQKYVELAVNLAMSLRLVDPKRPICLVHDDKVRLPSDADRYFDSFVLIPQDPAYVGVMNKILLYRHSPYRRTMFVDADCLMVRDGVDFYWDAFAGSAFAVLGGKMVNGTWGGHDVAELLARFDAPYIVSMNSGAFYCERGDAAERFFSVVDDLYRRHAADISCIHQGRANQYADEPILGLAMGLMEIEPHGIIPSCGSLMVTTWRSRRCCFDFARRHALIEKPKGFYLNLPVWPLAKGWVVHHPVFAHFVGTRPAATYRALVVQMRQQFEGRRCGGFGQLGKTSWFLL